MVDETRPGMFPPIDAARSAASQGPSRAASIGTLGGVGTIALGVLGQFTFSDAVAFEMITALGLAGLASLVFAYQQKLG
jgi:hypothetical protein